MSFVRTERHDAVAVVTLDRPERLNAISLALLTDLHAALAGVAADPTIGAIVLTGAGRAFCAGDDLQEFDDQARDAASAREHVEAIQQITRDLMLGDRPVVGAVHGYAVGGGFEWMLNCDLVVAADDLVAFFPETAIGQFVTGGVSWLLPLAIGHQRAMELLLLGERQGAARLLELGLVNRIVERAALVATAIALAAEVAERSRWSVTRLKRLLTSDLHGTLERALALETEATVEAFLGPDAAAGVERFRAR